MFFDFFFFLESCLKLIESTIYKKLAKCPDIFQSSLESISSKCLCAAFSGTNALALNYYVYYQQCYSKFYYYTQLEVTPNFYTGALCHAPVRSP